MRKRVVKNKFRAEYFKRWLRGPGMSTLRNFWKNISPERKIVFVSFVQQYARNEFLLLTRYSNLRDAESRVNLAAAANKQLLKITETKVSSFLRFFWYYCITHRRLWHFGQVKGQVMNWLPWLTITIIWKIIINFICVEWYSVLFCNFDSKFLL